MRNPVIFLEVMKYRGSRYNKHPNTSGYFGSYSMDALAIALHCVYHTNSFIEAIEKCVNLRGDSDTTGAICGQIAGAIYGYQSIPEHLKETLGTWDHYEIALRAILLFDIEPKTKKNNT